MWGKDSFATTYASSNLLVSMLCVMVSMSVSFGSGSWSSGDGKDVLQNMVTHKASNCWHWLSNKSWHDLEMSICTYSKYVDSEI